MWVYVCYDTRTDVCVYVYIDKRVTDQWNRWSPMNKVYVHSRWWVLMSILWLMMFTHYRGCDDDVCRCERVCSPDALAPREQGSTVILFVGLIRQQGTCTRHWMTHVYIWRYDELTECTDWRRGQVEWWLRYCVCVICIDITHKVRGQVSLRPIARCKLRVSWCAHYYMTDWCTTDCGCHDTPLTPLFDVDV